MPGRQQQAARCQPSIGASSSGTSGRGPTRLISPRSDVEQLGQLVERRPAQEAPDARDARVVGDLEQAVAASLSCTSSRFSASAPSTIVRNLSISNCSAVAADPRAGGRGPGRARSSLIASAITASSGESTSRPSARADEVDAALERPRERLRQPVAAHAEQRAARRCRRTSTDEPTTSNRRGSTLTFTPSAFTCRMTSRISLGVRDLGRDDHAVDLVLGQQRAPARWKSPRIGVPAAVVRRVVQGDAADDGRFHRAARARACARSPRPRPRVADHEAALRRERAARRPGAPTARPIVIKTNSRAQRTSNCGAPEAALDEDALEQPHQQRVERGDLEDRRAPRRAWSCGAGSRRGRRGRSSC